MSKYIIKVGTAVSSLALIASSFASSALAITIDVEGNGASSNSTLNVNQSSNTSVNQSNNATITNNVNASAGTGSNDANKNTGGDVQIKTGDATSNATVNNTANANWADINGCCPGDVNVTVKGNGAKSDNDVILNIDHSTNVTQDNNAKVKNNVNANADTGYNDANKNTGGNVSVNTGDSDSSVNVTNKLNANGAVISGNGNGGGTLSIEIVGNGEKSDNDVDLNVTSGVTLYQDNYANVTNNVNSTANTGENDANKNTGGNTSIDTGDANASADVSTLANFNWADLDGCGCLFNDDSTVKVKGNGADSANDVILDLSAGTIAAQENDLSCGGGRGGEWGPWSWNENKKGCNNVNANADTGYNDANKNTQAGEPSVTTGDADTWANVDNTVNSNILGNGNLDIPDFPGFGGESVHSLIVTLLALFS